MSTPPFDWRWLRRLTLRVRSLLFRNRVEQELADEFQFHLDARTAVEIARGLTPQEARRVAIRAMGGIEQYKEECRDARGTQLVENFVQDLHYGLRGLVKHRGFAIAAIVSLALGIGANTAIFSIINALLLDSLPVERPQELALLNPAGFRNGWTAGGHTWSYPAYRGLRDRQRVFSGLIAGRTDAVILTIDGASRRAMASLVSGNYFDVLGVRPFQGRLLSSDDDRIRGGHPVVVLSYGFWVEHFGMRPDVVGRDVRIGGHPFTIVGIAERRFNGLEVGDAVDVFVPAAMLREVVTYGEALDARNAFIFHVYGRLAPGISREQAEEQLQSLYLAELELDIASMGARAPSGDGWRLGRIVLEDGRRGTSLLRQDLETPLVAVMAMTVALLMITCANIAGLQIARASARMREMGIRLALGASRGRVVRQLLTESTLLVAFGALAGLWVASVVLARLVGELGDASNRLQLATTFLDARVLAFTLAFGGATTIVVGLVPALLATRPAVWLALRAGASADAGGPLRLRRVLVTAQLALSLVLVTASGLFGQTVYNLRHADAGFRTDRLVQFQLNTGAARYDRSRSEDAFRQLLETLRSVPGVDAATLAVAPVLDNALIGFGLDVEGYSNPQGTRARAAANAVAPGYFGMVGTPLVRGRDFSETDTAQSRRVAIVSESFVTRYLPDRDPIGQRIGLGYGGTNRFQHEIVGVAKDARLNNLRDEPTPTFYLPYTQFDVLNSAFFIVRAAVQPQLLRRPIEELVRRQDPDLPVIGYLTLDEQIDRLLRPERLVASLSLSFGLLATGLGAIGLYGVMAFVVARRTREIGVRMALGAGRGTVLRMVLGGAAAMAAIGIVVGAGLALALGGYVESQLYGIASRDLGTLGAAAAMLVATAIISAALPARRASRIDPVLALRCE
jgi:putative ABC transport system permease protein